VKVTPTNIPGVVIIEPKVFPDARGSFRTVFRADEYASAGVEHCFVQDNVSESHRGVLRGLHFQHPQGQGKLVYALRGEVFDVAVDVRIDSPTFGRAVWTTLSDENHRQVFIPPGFAHGFVVTSDHAVLAYKCSALYAPKCEQVIRWNDPSFDIPWPVLEPILAPRDAGAPLLAEIPVERLPRVAP
jgi:dTDP-4-dehydrorhamnose 3,5-epimerase